MIIFLNKSKPKDRAGKIFLLNASREFKKGDPKNYITEDGIVRIADTFRQWNEVDKYSRIVTITEIANNDFHISPSRFIHNGENEKYRPISELLEELDCLEAAEQETMKLLRKTLRSLPL